MHQLLKRIVLHTARTFASRAASPARSFSEAPVSIRQSASATGLYGYDVLKSASGFQAFAQDAIEKSEDLIERIRQTQPSMETISLFDELSDTVCTVVDSAELCRNTHCDSEFVEEASRASMTIYEYLNRLNTNPVLYDAIVKVEKAKALTTEEAKRAAFTHRVEFERGGVHLCHEKQERIRQLHLQTTQLERKFMKNLLEDPGHIDIFPASRAPKPISRIIKPISWSEKGVVKNGVRVTTDSENLCTILKWVKDREIRRQAYMEGYSKPKGNLVVIDDLIASRHETAQILGYESFADFNLAPTMAASSDVVHSFLLDLSERLRSKADEELAMLVKFGQDSEGASFKGLNPWDEAYYMCLMKAGTYGLNAKVVASYFPLNQCIEGLKLITKSLFGAVLEEVRLARGESWHANVQKFRLYHPSEGDLGHVYMDLYSRPAKFPGSAQFALKGGRRISEDKYQLPVVVVVCNFSRPSSMSYPVLNHWELETLFHEFGHALHSLLTRAAYQHFSGTRTVLDFVEIPSNLFENYAWDYRVLSKFARHYATGDPIPLEMVTAMRRSKDMFAATQLQQQVLYAMIDLTLFGRKPLPAKDTTSVIASLKHKHTSYKHVEGTHWHARFNHLITYGAGMAPLEVEASRGCFLAGDMKIVCR
ncbi:hypothetical protein GOP47_0017417 [Adiantum capillus-veneris]|uniref:Peptidase M3A/M3B catalytic domain-containing protein n=1 Tax=Adiantum capillus-veneris TaxID=13818 RepID=A0A9D4UFB6_ADICA|nr:hypothetical protein GOP47_0017417 [Adiantum capillus-veneris]